MLQGLISGRESTVTDHQKSIGLGLIQVSAEQQPQITAAACQPQGIAGRGRQEAQRIPMAFKLEIQRITQ